VLMQDIHHAFRLFLGTPIVTATAMLTIALGVGSTTAVFSVVCPRRAAARSSRRLRCTLVFRRPADSGNWRALAIGAERGQIMALVLRAGLPWALSGIAIGSLGAFALSRVLGILLFEVRARDPITYFTVSVTLALVATIACCIPAARATRIDPVVALRTD
jgi:hypothetical protein